MLKLLKSQLKLLTLIVLTHPSFLWAQKEIKIQTDSSVIEKDYRKYSNSILVFNRLKKEDKTYFSEYYYDTKRLHEKGGFGKDGSVGIWNLYNEHGRLIRQINYDDDVITYYDKKRFPFYAFQDRRKLMADNFIKNIYSPEFFVKYLTWDIEGSYMYNGENEPGNWTDALKTKPDKFLVRYGVKLGGHSYSEMIELEIDSNGKLSTNELNYKGFEKLNTNQPKIFKLNVDSAIEFAKQKGLMETDSSKAQAFLFWEKLKPDSIYDGRFRYYVMINTESIKNLNPKGRSTIIKKYNIYSFNPWTGEFVEKKKMKSIYGWEKFSGSSSGLLPDN